MLTFPQEIWLKILEGAMIAVPVLLIGIIIHRNLKTFKSDKQHQSDTSKSIRLALAELAKNLAACIHSMTWLCWSVKHSPAAIRGNLKAYNTEMHKQLSELMASRVNLAAQDEEKYSILVPFMAKMVALDVKVGEVAAGCLSINPMVEAAAQKELIICYKEAIALDSELLTTVSYILQVRN